ncbi:MAG: YfhO family protein, partial [Thermoanaerobaculia bacterium]
GYTGLLAFAGAWLALLAARDRRAWPFVGFAGAGLLLAGRFLPLAQLLYVVPPLRMPAYARLLPVVSLALCVGGAFGTDLLLGRGRSRSRGAVAIWTSLALAALLSLAVAADRWTVALWVLLAMAAALAGWRPRWGAVALAAVLLLDLIPWSRSLLPVGDPSLFYPRSALMNRLVLEAGDPAAGRATGGDYLVYPGLLQIYGVADFRAHDPLASADYLHVLDLAFGFHPSMEHYFAPVRNLDHPLLDFLGVRAVVGSPAVPRYRTLPRVDHGRFWPFTLMRNPDALPRWFFPCESVAIERGDLDRWIVELTAACRVAVFRDEVGAWRSGPGGPASPELRVVSAAPGRVVLEVPPGGERLLASSVPFSRGWSARAGGRALPTLHVDGAFLGVRLPAGASRVELRFLPPGFVTGCGAFGLALGAFLGLLFLPRLGRKGRKAGMDGDKELK